MPQHYDIDRAVQEAGLPPDLVGDILAQAKAEFPEDEMMFELHVIRSIQAEMQARMTPEEWRCRVSERAARIFSATH